VNAILLLLITLVIPASSSAQEDDRMRMYRVAVIMYQGRQVDAALRVAASWKADNIRRDARQLLDDRDKRLAPAVALLLTESARRDMRAGGPERFAVAELLVTSLRRNSPDIRAFQERWFAFMASVFVAELIHHPLARSSRAGFEWWATARASNCCRASSTRCRRIHMPSVLLPIAA